MKDRPTGGETWVYESLVGAFPAVSVSGRTAVTVQLVAFELGVLFLAWIYALPTAAVVGTAAVIVAAAGSVAMLRIGGRIRTLDVPAAYTRVLFGSSAEVVLGLLAYAALLTYLFTVDPRDGTGLVTALLGPEPSVPATFLALLVLWDVCYRFGTAWWAALVGCWRSYRYRFAPGTARQLRRVDLETAGFSLVQLVLVPFVAAHEVLLVGLVGHVAAVVAVTGLSVALLARGETGLTST